MADKSGGSGGRPPTKFYVHLHDTLRPISDLVITRLSPTRIQDNLRTRLVAALKRFRGLPVWVDDAAKTLPFLDLFAFSLVVAGSAVTAETLTQPWLFSIALWTAILGITVFSVDWRAKYLRRVKSDKRGATYCVLANVVAFVVIGGSQIGWPIYAHREGVNRGDTAQLPIVKSSVHFEGTILRAVDVLLPKLDHRIVLIEATIRNTGTMPSNLSSWSVSGSDSISDQLLYGLIIQPSRGVIIEGHTRSGIFGTARYDKRSYLVNEGHNVLGQGDSIDGLLIVEFQREVNTMTLKIGFEDHNGTPYTAECLNCQTMP